ncbi:MAG: sugar ABC transporter permease [Candidatus Bathyarchaeia archaeon]|nr:sugar ABC transporter permease [Candidatus Bathyarchaeota archaeon]
MRSINPWLIFLPAFIIVGFNSFVPILYGAYLTMLRFYMTGQEMQFLGYGNYMQLVLDSTVWDSLLKGAAFVGTCLAIELPTGLAIALVIYKESRINRILRTIFSSPLLIPPLTVGATWLLLTRADIGPLPLLLRLFGVNYDIGSNPFQAFFTVVAMDVWHWTSFVILVFVAARAALPPEPYESAMVDGASSWHMFRYITLPGMKYAILIVLLIRMIDSLKIFDEVWALIGEGPYRATNFMSIYIVKTTLSQLNMGYGATLSLFFLYLIIILTFITLKVMTGRRT